MMYVPVHSAGKVAGILSVQSYAARAYSQADLELLQILADHFGETLERLRWREGLHRSDAALSELAAVLEHSGDAIYGETPGGTIVSWNRAAGQIYGYPAVEIIGQPVASLVPPNQRDELAALMQDLRAGMDVQHLETLRRTKAAS